MFANKSSKLLGLIYIALVIWWFTIHFRELTETTENFLYSFVYGLVPLVWGVIGLRNSKEWGGFKSVMGKSTAFLSFGLIAWATGNLIWAYYNLVLRIGVPYPSPADFIFILSFPLWAIGLFYISKATGATFSTKEMKGKVLVFLIPIVIIMFSYYFLYIIARGGVIDTTGGGLKLFLDIAFPVWDVILLTLASLVLGLSFRYLGGYFRLPVLILLIGFFVNYIVDFSFSYTTTLGTFYVGNWVDLLFATAVCIISLGVSLLNPSSKSLHTT